MFKLDRSLTLGMPALALVAMVSTAGAVGPIAPRPHPAAPASIVPVQSKPNEASLIVSPSINAVPGGTVKLPIAVSADVKASSLFVMLHKVPDWLDVKGGEKVGAGVWLVAASLADQIEARVGATAAGEQAMLIALLAADGKIAREVPLKIVAAGRVAATPAPTAAAVTPVTAPATPTKTWEGILSEQAKSVAVAGAGTRPGATTAGAPNNLVVAQAAPTAKAAPVAAAGTMDEAKLVEYARFLVRECTTCHSLYGEDVGIPLMIGLPRDRFIDTMRLYKNGRRDHPPMQSVAQALSDEETLALALYLGRIRPPTPAALTSAAPASSPAVSALPRAAPKRATPESADRIARWIKRGEELIASGEIAQARLFLERASEYGSARAAYLLGTSFDPNTQAWRPGIGLSAEPLAAREWYLYAQRLGDTTDAPQRLADLPTPR